jgi:hypothetical protein
MRNTLIPASFLAMALATEKKVLKTDNEILVIREEDSITASRLYRLFFNEQRSVAKPAIHDELNSDTDYYSSYE